MPDNPIEPRFYRPIAPTVPQPVEMDEEQEAPEQESKPGWDWVGSPSRPEAQEEEDGISDLFRVTPEDVGASEDDLSDLTDVDIEKDILDGDLSDLTDVFEEDVMGEGDMGQKPSQKFLRSKRTDRDARRYGEKPPTSLGGMRG